MELDMDMNAAVDAAVDTATTKGTGEPVTEEPAAEETPPKNEVETPAEKPPEEAPAEETVDDGELARRLAELTHDEVVQTPAGQGLTAEMKRVRDRNRELEAEIKALQEAAEAPTDDDDEDKDVFTVADVNKVIDRRLAAATKPADKKPDVASLTQVMATGLAALKADKSIPDGLDVGAIVEDAMKKLKASRRGTYDDMLSEPDPVRAVWEYATARMPAAKSAMAKAVKAQADVEAERLAKGQDPDTGDKPQDISSLVADLNA